MSMTMGVVQKISTRDWTNPEGENVKFYSLQMDGEWYSNGSRVLACAQGDTVQFHWQAKGKYKNITKGTLEVTAAGSGAPAAAPAAAAPKAAVGSRDDYWAKKDAYDKEVRQKLIMYQSATKDAVSIAVAALNKDILPTTGQKKQDKWDSYMAVVQQVRDQIYLSFEEAERKLEAGEVLVKKPEPTKVVDTSSPAAPVNAAEDVDALPEDFNPF